MSQALFPRCFCSLRARGFSLIEMVAVIAIVAILAVAATAYFDRTTFDSAAFNDLAKSAVSQAQKVAVAQRQTVFVVVAAGSLSVCYDALCASPVSAPAGVGAGAPGVMIYPAPTGISLSPVTTFSFDGLGRPSTAVSIAVTGAAGFSVAAETGYVQ